MEGYLIPAHVLCEARRLGAMGLEVNRRDGLAVRPCLRLGEHVEEGRLLALARRAADGGMQTERVLHEPVCVQMPEGDAAVNKTVAESLIPAYEFAPDRS